MNQFSKKLKLLKIEDILKLNGEQKLPVYFQQHQTTNNTVQMFLLKQNNEIHENNTRSKNKLYIIGTNHSFAQKCHKQNLPCTINETPTHIKNKINTHSIHRIKTDMKLPYIEKYGGNCVI